MGYIFPLNAGSVYSTTGTAGSADYTLYLNNAGGAFSGPAYCQISTDTWAGSAMVLASLDGTTFFKPNLTCMRAGTSGQLAWVAGPVGGPVTVGTAFVLTSQAPLKALRLTTMTVSGTVASTWGANSF